MEIDAESVPALTGERLEMLRALGFADLQHDSHVPFLSHLVGTRRLLASWGERPALCDAGLFHSVYGTEYFEPDRTPARAAVKAIVGEEAERIAWLWCAIRRDTIDGARRTVQLRRDDSTEPLTTKEVVDLATLWAADTVEQVKRMAPEERSFARGLGAVLGLASPPAQDAVAALGPAWEG
jgi:xanthine dehydrogenase iron-sulfur cluster and FAD-binding subunit A